MDQAHAKSPEELVRYFGVDPENGLTDQQVKDAQARYGLNGTEANFFPVHFGVSSYFSPEFYDLWLGFLSFPELPTEESKSTLAEMEDETEEKFWLIAASINQSSKGSDAHVVNFWFFPIPFTAKPLWALILEQFDDLLVKILLSAAIISFVSG